MQGKINAFPPFLTMKTFLNDHVLYLASGCCCLQLHASSTGIGLDDFLIVACMLYLWLLYSLHYVHSVTVSCSATVQCCFETNTS